MGLIVFLPTSACQQGLSFLAFNPIAEIGFPVWKSPSTPASLHLLPRVGMAFLMDSHSPFQSFVYTMTSFYRSVSCVNYDSSSICNKSEAPSCGPQDSSQPAPHLSLYFSFSFCPPSSPMTVLSSAFDISVFGYPRLCLYVPSCIPHLSFTSREALPSYPSQMTLLQFTCGGTSVVYTLVTLQLSLITMWALSILSIALSPWKNCVWHVVGLQWYFEK